MAEDQRDVGGGLRTCWMFENGLYYNIGRVLVGVPFLRIRESFVVDLTKNKFRHSSRFRYLTNRFLFKLLLRQYFKVYIVHVCVSCHRKGMKFKI